MPGAILIGRTFPLHAISFTRSSRLKLSSAYQQRTSSSSSRRSGCPGLRGKIHVPGCSMPATASVFSFSHARDSGSEALSTSSPRRTHHPRQAEVVADDIEHSLTGFLCVGVGFINARQRPVTSAEALDSAGEEMLVQAIDEFTSRHARIVAMHDVHLNMIHFQPIERFDQLLRDELRLAKG